MIEFEATFPDINKEEIRERLRNSGANLAYPERLMKRVVFYHPDREEHSWIRVRDEGDKITLSYKSMPDRAEKIEEQKEICLEIDSFEAAKEFLLAIGCEQANYMETKRETWNLAGAEIVIDEWPYLRPFVEIEGGSEEAVRSVSENLGFDYAKAIFGNVYALYSLEYDIPIPALKQIIEKDRLPLTFESPNPFLQIKKASE